MQTDRHARAGKAASAASPADPLTGRLLDGRYRVGRRIARGGMASVYEATDTRLDRTVAVKVMHPGLGDDDEFAARFVREAHAAARLSHPNVVAVFDQGNDDGVVFLAMEMVVGHTLRDTISQESPMSPARAIALLEPVLAALATAHRAGLVHRDVKPENVLIAEDGRIKVADFGLAKAVSADTQHTATGGVLIGTLSYLAPELVVEGRADERADVYAAGVVLFELLTGRKPHEGESPIQVAWKHVHEDVPAPSSLVPGIPAYVDALVARATARDRGQRPADAGVLLHHVRRVSLALADGLSEDADLTEDLRPRPVPESEQTRVVPLLPGGAGAEEATAPFAVLAPSDLASPEPSARASSGSTEAAGTDLTTRVPMLDGPDGPKDHDEPEGAAGPAEPGRRPRRSRRGPLLLVLALVLAVAVGGGAYWFGWARYTHVPAVISLSESAATDRLEAAGLDVEAGDPAYSETVPKGEVIDTDPGAGERILDGGAVTLTVSLGPERYQLPRLTGTPRAQAEERLTEIKASVGRTTERWSEKIPEGAVIRTVPAAGKILAPGANVELVVSKGRRPIPVGKWVGEDLDDAEAALEKRGLRAEVEEERFSDDVPEGVVISQSPREGTLFRDDAVSFVVSKGPEMVEIPGGLRGSGVEEAIAKLEAAGFKVKTEESALYVGLRYVVGVSPGSGKSAPKGSTVTLSLV
ncbi:Stk1 family PASTA domain-containing Ser/Thr kinase [Nocardioides sp. zg-DK7169]|uniref:Stk1 family PASTA domain-containing Ser/Thr kinase n=1 Tax=Nocardioides sp. zg-DK7169 TaxID=2736600 RepID=UPI003463C035